MRTDDAKDRLDRMYSSYNIGRVESEVKNRNAEPKDQLLRVSIHVDNAKKR